MVAESLADSISSIAIGEAQLKVEQTPSDHIAPPQASGSYVVDRNVIAGMSA